jgi:drug/metabolite transporter (DMT)-like permease
MPVLDNAPLHRAVESSPSAWSNAPFFGAHTMMKSDRLRGITSMILAVCVFSIMDATMKRLSSHYAPLQISCMRSVASLICIVAPIVWRRSWADLKASSPLLHVARGVLGISMLVTFVFAVNRLTLAQTYSFSLAAPLLMTALSVPLFGDRVSRARWSAIIAGLAGVLIVLQPWSKGAIPLAAAAAAAAATVCYSLSALSVRSLGNKHSSISMVFWYLALVSVGAGALCVASWQPIRSEDWKWLAAVGVSGALGQYWLTDAFRRAPASVVGPFEYTAIIWAFLIDWIFWAAYPSAALIVGAIVVIASGIFVIFDEKRMTEVDLMRGAPMP